MTRKEEGEDGATTSFAGEEVTATVNSATANFRNVAHLLSLASNQRVEKMDELKSNSVMH